jgi:hypothetical protein
MNGLGDYPQFVCSTLCEGEVIEDTTSLPHLTYITKETGLLVLIVVFNISLIFVGLEIINGKVNILETSVIVILWYIPLQLTVWLAMMLRSGIPL